MGIDSEALLFCAPDSRGKRIFPRSLTITAGLLESRLPADYPTRNKASPKRVNIHVILASSKQGAGTFRIKNSPTVLVGAIINLLVDSNSIDREGIEWLGSWMLA